MLEEQSSQGASQGLKEFQYEIEDVIALSVVSSFYTADAAETEVASYILTGLNQDKLDIQVKFSQPNKISQS